MTAKTITPKLAQRMLHSSATNGDQLTELEFLAAEIAWKEQRPVTYAEVKRICKAQGVKFDRAGWIVE